MTTDLSDFEGLARAWRAFLANDTTGNDGYNRGVEICARQLEETIARMTALAEADL